MKPWLIASSGLAALIFAAGFLYPEAVPPPTPIADTKRIDEYAGATAADHALISNPNRYRLSCECSLQVDAVLALEEQLKTLLKEHDGTIEQLEIEGNERGRAGFAVVSLPASDFDAFVRQVRELGRMIREHLSAVAYKPGGDTGAGGAAVAQVRIDFTDIHGSADVDESKGVLASSFDRGASHFLKGSAVLVEGFGYALPYLIFGMLAGVPLWGLARLRARRESAARAPAPSV